MNNDAERIFKTWITKAYREVLDVARTMAIWASGEGTTVSLSLSSNQSMSNKVVIIAESTIRVRKEFSYQSKASLDTILEVMDKNPGSPEPESLKDFWGSARLVYLTFRTMQLSRDTEQEVILNLSVDNDTLLLTGDVTVGQETFNIQSVPETRQAPPSYSLN